MGLDRTVPMTTVPEWGEIELRAKAVGMSLPIRMIDGELAFPDEVPPTNWREVRVGLPEGMITLRRVPEGIALTVWGNADAGLLGAVERLADSIAQSRDVLE